MVAPKEVFYHNPPDLPTFLSQNTLHKNTHEKMGVSDGCSGLLVRDSFSVESKPQKMENGVHDELWEPNAFYC